MSDTFAGLTRRLNAFVHDRETSEELSHIIDEAKDIGGDAADALIELALGEEHLDDELLEGDDESLEAAVEDDELTDDVDDDEGDLTDDEIDGALDELEDGLDDDDDEDSLGEATLRSGEVLVI